MRQFAWDKRRDIRLLGVISRLSIDFIYILIMEVPRFIEMIGLRS